MAPYVLIGLLLCAAAPSADFKEDFASLRAKLWQLDAGGEGKAEIADGRLVLDMSQPKKGKWAVAHLHLAIPASARVEWRQCLAHDTRHTYFCGLALGSRADGKGGQVTAGLGGGGLGRRVFLGNTRSEEGRVEPGQWYRLVLDVASARQSLTVYKPGSTKPLMGLDTWTVLGRGPLFLRFFQNDPRQGPAWPDGYEQDRGITWIDDLRVSASKLKPQTRAQPVTTHPLSVPVVFSRAMRWITRADGLSAGCIAYDAAGWLPLTGERAASRWLELRPWPKHDPTRWPVQNEPEPAGDVSVFRLPDDGRKATFVLRALQFNLDQHPVLEWEVEPGGVECQVDVAATDGVRPFLWTLWQGAWVGDADRGTVNLRSLYRAAGRPSRYAEMDVRLRLRRTEGSGRGQARLRLGLIGQSAVVPRWPVVARAGEGSDKGVMVEAIVVDASGRVVRDASVKLSALAGGRVVRMPAVTSAGLRRGVVTGLGSGDHDLRVAATDAAGRPLAATTMTVSVTGLDFLDHYDPAKRSYCTVEGRAAGPLLGDLFAWVPYSALTREHRRLILGMDQREEGKRLHYTKWRALPRGDIDTYIGYMADSGVRVLRLTPNVSPGEYYLDAGGRLAPHGMEQFAYILAAARRDGMRAVINLHHYPYLSGSTGRKPPVQRYVDAGYPKEMTWTSDAMWSHLSSYLEQLLGFTGDDPAVMAYSVMGENDQFLPEAWLNRAYEFIKTRTPRQMVVLEQGGCLRKDADGRRETWQNFKPAADAGVGYRGYHTQRHQTDCFLAVAARLFDMTRPSFLGEVSCGIHTSPGFVTKYRDAMGIALTLQQPMSIAWSAAMVEGQCKAFTQAARRVDWAAFRRARPPVAVIVDRVESRHLTRLVQIEDALASLPVDYEYVGEPAARGQYDVTLDARAPASAGPVTAALPAEVLERLPLRLSPGNHCSYAVSEDRRWLVAYVRNAGHYEMGLCDIRSVGFHRLADRKRQVTIDLRGFDGSRHYRVWDAGAAAVLRSGAFTGSTRLEFDATAADLLLLVEP